METASLVTVRTLSGDILVEIDGGVWTVADLISHLMSLKPPGSGYQYQLVFGAQPLAPESLLQEIQGKELIALVYGIPAGEYKYSCSCDLQPDVRGTPKTKTASIYINLTADGRICIVFTTTILHFAPARLERTIISRFCFDRVAHGTWRGTGGLITAMLTECEFFEAHPPGTSSVEPLREVLELSLTVSSDLYIRSSKLEEGRSMMIFGPDTIYKRVNKNADFEQESLFPPAVEEELAHPKRGCCDLL